jgi:hypothetical protein
MRRAGGKMMGDIKNPHLLHIKGGLFVLLGVMASAGILWLCPSFKIGLLLVIAIWSFCRAYYFVFYVIGHYVDPEYRFASLTSFVRYILRKR